MDFLSERVASMAGRRMEGGLEGLWGAAHGARSEACRNPRNGCRERWRHTRAGCLTAMIPKLRGLGRFPGFPEPRRAPSARAAVCLQ